MRTPANIAKHPIHPMLVPIPIGLWIFSLVCDLIHAGGSANPAWPTVALYTMGGGIVGALAAAVPGLIDLLSLPAEPKKTAITHMAINLTVVALYVINFWMRISAPADAKVPLLLSIIAIGLLVISGWLGGKMVYVYGIAVDAASDTTPPGRR
ncbi:MAG: hypothetical protein V7640_2845 [Betaproteobacteria bacterium]